LHGSVKPGGIFSAVIALYFEHQDRLVEKALAAPAHSRLWHFSDIPSYGGMSAAGGS